MTSSPWRRGRTSGCSPPSRMFWPPGAASSPRGRCRRQAFTIGPALEAGGTTDGLLFLQPLELNGTRGARTNVAHAQLRLSQAQALVQLQSLVYTARAYFYALARAQAALALQQDLLATAQRFDQIARQQVALGARPGIEQTQTAIEVARARQLVAQAQGEEQAARAALNAYLGRAPLDPIDATPAWPPAAPATPPVDIAAAQQQALDGRAEVAAAQASRMFPPPRPPCTAPRAARTSPRRSASARSRRPTWTPAWASSSPCRSTTAPAGARSASRSRPPRPRRTAWREHRPRSGSTPSRPPSASMPPRASWASTTPACSPTPARCWTPPCSGFRPGRRRSSRVLDAERTYRQIVSDQLNARASVAEARAALDRATGALPPSLLPELERDFHLSEVENRLVMR